jgi:FkbM family methyltransferase
MIGLMRNVAAIAGSRELPPHRIAAAYATLRARRAIGSHPRYAKLLDWELAYADYDAVVTLFEEIFIRRVYPFRRQVPNPLVVDCGANIGVSTFYFKSIAPDAHVLAFEPQPTAFALLEENVRHNRLASVECFPIALAREPGVVTLHTPGPAASGASLHFHGPDWSSTEVEARRLSNQLGGRHVDFLKLDVEGSEHEILKDLSEADVLCRVGELAVEFHPRQTDDFVELLQMLSDGGFRYRIAVVGDRFWEPVQLLAIHAFRGEV